MNIAVIPARGGSERLPGKNIKPFHGKPILAYSIETARESGLFEEIWVSTESEEIGMIAESLGAKRHRRPAVMAQAHVGTPEVMAGVMRDLCSAGRRIDYVCCIYPTAPLMLPADLLRGYNALMSKPEAPYAYSCALKPQRERDLRWDAGQWYWGPTDSFLELIPMDADDTLKVVIPQERVCDINTIEDFQRAEILYQAMQKVPA